MTCASESVSYGDEDATYKNAYQDPFSSTFYKVFSEVFENEREAYAADIQVELNLSFDEAANSCKKNVSFSAQVPCDSCCEMEGVIQSMQSSQHVLLVEVLGELQFFHSHPPAVLAKDLVE